MEKAATLPPARGKTERALEKAATSQFQHPIMGCDELFFDHWFCPGCCSVWLAGCRTAQAYARRAPDGLSRILLCRGVVGRFALGNPVRRCGVHIGVECMLACQ
jgi:hypothetical protein